MVLIEGNRTIQKSEEEREKFHVSVGWMSFGFSRYQRHDYKITVFSFTKRANGKDQNEWCSSKSSGGSTEVAFKLE